MPDAGCHCCRVACRLSVLCASLSEAALPANAVVLFQLLGVNGGVLTEALTHKKIIAKGEEVGLDTHTHTNPLWHKCAISICIQRFAVCVMSGPLQCNYIVTCPAVTL